MSAIAQAQTFGDIRVEGQSHLTINQILQISVAEVKTRAFVASSPYPGLRRFEERNKDFFFGRDRLVEQLLALVSQKNLVLVAGASGSGKSSVVRAGLLPQLAARFAQGRFRALVMTPDRDPFLSLHAALRSAGVGQRQLTPLDAGTSESVQTVLASQRPRDEQWLLFVDQFEEMFTLCGNAERRAAFLSGLTELAQQAQTDIKIVLAMRADFFDRFGPHPIFGSLAQQGLQLALDMEASSLRAAIEQPAAKHGVVFEEGLVEQIIADVKGRPGALPLLQYTLDLLWRTDNPFDDRMLNAASYHRIGGIEGALRLRADALFDFADPQTQAPRPADQQARMRQIFLRLVDLTNQSTDARVVARRASITDFPGAEELALIKDLTDETLLVTNATRLAAQGPAQGTVEIAHEALLSAWPLLRSWIDQGREAIYLRNRLSADAREWAQARVETPSRADEELWSGARLAQALAMRERKDFINLLGGLTQKETEFLDASATLHSKHDPTGARSFRRLVAVMAVTLDLALIGLGGAEPLQERFGSVARVTVGIAALTAFASGLSVIFRRRLSTNLFHRDIVFLTLIGLGSMLATSSLCLRFHLSVSAHHALTAVSGAAMFASIAVLYLPDVWGAAAGSLVAAALIALWPSESLLIMLVLHPLCATWFCYSWLISIDQRKRRRVDRAGIYLRH